MSEFINIVVDTLHLTPYLTWHDRLPLWNNQCTCPIVLPYHNGVYMSAFLSKQTYDIRIYFQLFSLSQWITCV